MRRPSLHFDTQVMMCPRKRAPEFTVANVRLLSCTIGVLTECSPERADCRDQTQTLARTRPKPAARRRAPLAQNDGAC